MSRYEEHIIQGVRVLIIVAHSLQIAGLTIVQLIAFLWIVEELAEAVKTHRVYQARAKLEKREKNEALDSLDEAA